MKQKNTLALAKILLSLACITSLTLSGAQRDDAERPVARATKITKEQLVELSKKVSPKITTAYLKALTQPNVANIDAIFEACAQENENYQFAKYTICAFARNNGHACIQESARNMYGDGPFETFDLLEERKPRSSLVDTYIQALHSASQASFFDNLPDDECFHIATTLIEEEHNTLLEKLSPQKRATLRCPKGFTLLHHAIYEENVEAANLLLKTNRELLDTPSLVGHTPLHTAASNGLLAMVNFLLAHGANAKIKNGAGNTPLHMAVLCGDDKPAYHAVADKLLKYDIGLMSEKNNDGETALYIAWDEGYNGIRKIFAGHEAVPALPEQSNKKKKPKKTKRKKLAQKRLQPSENKSSESEDENCSPNVEVDSDIITPKQMAAALKPHKGLPLQPLNVNAPHHKPKQVQQPKLKFDNHIFGLPIYNEQEERVEGFHHTNKPFPIIQQIAPAKTLKAELIDDTPGQGYRVARLTYTDATDPDNSVTKTFEKTLFPELLQQKIKQAIETVCDDPATTKSTDQDYKTTYNGTYQFPGHQPIGIRVVTLPSKQKGKPRRYVVTAHPIRPSLPAAEAKE